MADKCTLDRNAMKDRSTSHLRIYVGGLTEKATADDLYEHFIRYGKINGIVLNRNFGFIQFDNENSAQEAIAQANGSHFQGKNINVRTAQTSADKQKRHEVEVVTIEPEIPPAVALTDDTPVDEELAEDPYDNYGNYIGGQGNPREEEYEDRYNQSNQDMRGGARGRVRGRGGRGRGGPGSDYSNRINVADNVREEEYEDRYNQNDSRTGYDNQGGGRGRGRGRVMRGARGAGGGDFSARSNNPGGGDWSDRGNYDRFPPKMPDYSRPIPVTERNDCEIIVVSKSLTEYAEYIEGRLKRLGIVVDLLFPMEDVPIGKVLGNIASRGCLYGILVMPQNQEHRSLTLTILHGLPQEHRNMPLEDALQLMSRNFQEVQRGGTSGREAVYALLGQLADGRALTVLQYDKVIEYLQERREQQVKLELGEPLPTTAPANKTQAELQQRILSILNDKKVAPQNEPAPVPVPPPVQQEKTTLLKDPSVRKALDSILMKFT